MKDVVKNKHNCSNALWKKMSNPQRNFYNDLRSYTQKEICPSKTNFLELDDELFDVISHNFSYLASALLAKY